LSAKADRNSQSMQALLRLRELILSGEFPAGSRMSELPLVERLGVSRTPLRLALANLEHEGLLEPLSGGGYAVREFTQKDIDDAIELRGVLEGTAVRFAAERGVNRRQLSTMRECLEEIEEVVHEADYDSFVAYIAPQRPPSRPFSAGRAQPGAGAGARERPLAAIRRTWSSGAGAGGAARVAGDPRDRAEPPPRDDRSDRASRGCAGGRASAASTRGSRSEIWTSCSTIARCSIACPEHR